MANRRQLLLGVASLAAAQAARAQKEPPVVGVVMFALDTAPFQANFRQGLRELGYEEGRNLRLEWRAAAGQPELAAQHANELVRLGVSVIVAEFTPAVLAARKATSTIPIVMAPAGDPVTLGLVASLSRPGGNVTGFSNLVVELAGKRLQLLRAMVPGLANVGLVVSGSDPLDQSLVSTARLAAQSVSLQLHVANLKPSDDVDAVFERLSVQGCKAVIVPGNLPAQPQRVANAALRWRMASISLVSNFPEAGGLAFYGASLPDIQRRAAATVDRLLQGTRPGDMPVEQPTVFEFVLNLSTARRLGLDLPESVRLQATKVIE